MSLLKGFLQGTAGAGRFADYQSARKIATDQNAREQAKFDRTQRADAAGGMVNRLQTADLLDPENKTRLNIDAFRNGLENNDQSVRRIGLDIINNSGELGEGVTATNIRRQNNGGFVIETTNANGEKGAVTEDGSSDPESNVVTFEPGRLTNIANDYYRRNVIANLDDAGRSRYNVYVEDVRLVDLEIEALNLTEQRSGIGARRQLAGLLSDASPEETTQIVSEITGKPSPAPASDAKQEQIAALKERMGKLTGPGSDRPRREIQAEIDALEGKPASPEPKKPDPEQAAIQEEIDALKLRKDRIPTGRGGDRAKAAVQKKIDALESQLSPEEEPAPVIAQAAPKAAAAITDTTTVDEIDAAVDSGEVEVSESDAQAIAQKMQELEIEKISDLQKLNRKDRLLAYAALRLFTPNEQARENIRSEMQNIVETGVASYSAKDLDTARVNQQNANTSAQNAVTSRMSENRSAVEDLRGFAESTLTMRSDLGAALSAAVRDEDGDVSIDRQALRNLSGPGGALNKAKADFTTEVNAATRRQKQLVFNSGISAVIMGLSSDDAGGVFEGVKDAFGVQDDQESIQGNDGFFNRIEPVYASGGTSIKEFKIVDPRGGYMDEAVSAETVRSIFSDADTYAYLEKYLRLKSNGATADELASLAPAGN
ncbi:MAG: hypothetical protein CMJ25_21400 [Phycisphaerae bacterium]|nr:hypothetical protein [Phycisphaerae bacterium]|tara:strand:+ start:36726 stop:38696 length:1971 start_codon:yes stop_codon:yes gene_type:complete